VSWLVLLYFPAACLAVGGLGAWHLQSFPGRSLAASRLLVLGFPLLLLGACLAKPMGPPFWGKLARPLPGRVVILPLLFLLIVGRWVVERSSIEAFRQWEEGPGLTRAAEASIQRCLLKALAHLRASRFLASPSLHFSKVAVLAHLESRIRPRIHLEAELVPPRFRSGGAWWDSVPAEAEPPQVLAAAVAHELGHFRNGDHLRRLILGLYAAFLPWEWVIVDPLAKASVVSRVWSLRMWSLAMRWVGTPLRAWVREDTRIRESLADEAADRLVPGGAALLGDLRAKYPAVPEPPPRARRGRASRALRFCLLWGAAPVLLWAAPGRLPFTFLLGRSMESSDLPRSWCLVAAPGSEASAIFLPGRGEPGTIIVRCPRINLGQASLLRGMGRIPPAALPGECDVEMTWEVHYQGNGELTGKEAFLSLTQSAMTVRTNWDPFTAYSLPRGMEAMPGPQGWRRYLSITKIRGNPELEHMLIGFNLVAPGEYIFRPPVLTLVHPDGRRLPFPLS